MSLQTFEKALDFADCMESACPVRLTMISGGEPTDHPAILGLLDAVKARVSGSHIVMLLTNGLWLEDEKRRDELLGRKVFFQVTNDPRFYPKAPPRIEHPRVTYIDELSVMIPMGRFEGQTHAEVPTRRAPACFNLRSMTRSVRSAKQALAALRARAVSGGLGGFCTPSVCHDGTVVVGESRFCHPIGTVDSTEAEITEAICSVRCSKCGLINKLTQEHKRAVGEATLYTPWEP